MTWDIFLLSGSYQDNGGVSISVVLAGLHGSVPERIAGNSRASAHAGNKSASAASAAVVMVGAVAAVVAAASAAAVFVGAHAAVS